MADWTVVSNKKKQSPITSRGGHEGSSNRGGHKNFHQNNIGANERSYSSTGRGGSYNGPSRGSYRGASQGSSRGRGGHVSYNDRPSRNTHQNVNKEHLDLKEKIRKNASTVTYQECLDIIEDKVKSVDENEKARVREEFTMVLLYNLVKGSAVHQNCVKVLQDFIINNKFPKHTKQTKRSAYNLYNAVAWIDSCVSDENLTNVVKLIHNQGYDIFSNNDKGENALQSVLANNNLGDKQLFRYMEITKIVPDQVIKIVNSICNKITEEDHDQIWSDRLRFVLVVNPEIALRKFAANLITRKIPNACSKKDNSVGRYIKLLLESLSGVENGYRNIVSKDSSLAMFFKKHNYQSSTRNELLTIFWEEAQNYAFGYSTEGGADKQHENVSLDLEALSILIGEVASCGYLVDFYENFISNCLNDTQDVKFQKIDMETKTKMAIRAVAQCGIYSSNTLSSLQSTKKKFKSATYYDCQLSIVIEASRTAGTSKTSETSRTSIITPTLKTTTNTQLTNPYNSDNDSMSDDPNELNGGNFKKSDTFDEDHVFFSNIKSSNYDSVIDKAVKEILLLLKNFPKQRELIIQRILISLIEQIPKHLNDKANDVIAKLTFIEKQEFTSQKNYIDDIIDDVTIDVPNAPSVWKNIVQFF